MWEIVGYEKNVNEAGNVTGCTLYCQQHFKDADKGHGVRTCKEYYRPANIDYQPAIGDQVIFVKEQFGQYLVVTDIIRM